ncbi:unnamed protein product [Dovyalis caffra]|uniref:UTP-monosaccharide-1-phosphate uridylyltransferase n=1 Tax=Dovyalis caffra TaxID=77055 RepID=A0AAV1S643_9ROSI|nr:unnamed protein product [Dovyalis caffra]
MASAGATESLSKLNINGDFASSVPNLQKNLHLLSPQQIELAKMLVEKGQSHLFEHWPEPGVDDNEKKAFFDQAITFRPCGCFLQVARLDSCYPGGLTSYIKTARELLADSKAGKNPFDGFTPSVPTGESLTYGDENFIKFEEAGVREAQNAAFVLVAGGLGERLGYNGIKVALPVETTTGTCFLQLYIESVLALQEASSRMTQGGHKKEIPFVIMTSDDTHARTLELLESNSYFGMKPTQVKLLKQEKVACLEDNDARIALDPQNKFRVQTKPHGHGDVHSLLYSSGLLNEWHDAGLRWVLFFQDTNGLLFKAIPAAIGVSATKGYHVNSLAVPRKAKEAIGGITRLTHTDGRSMVINVEYNQLDPLLRATGFPDGDANCETGYSPFPGNINQLIMELDPYIEELKKTGGAIKEFVNPKYKDSSRTSFKSSTRLECMMQDYPRTLPPSAKVGFTVMDTWLAYSPVKNNPEDAAKVPKGNPYHSATSGEMAIYRANSLILRKIGVHVGNPINEVFNGQEVEVWPRIVWKPKWGLTFVEIRSKVSGSCSITQRSSMAIKGRNIFVKDLSLDGALVVDSIDEAEYSSNSNVDADVLICLEMNSRLVEVGGSVQNKGWILEKVDYKDTSVPEEIRIRGFRFKKIEQLEKHYKGNASLLSESSVFGACLGVLEATQKRVLISFACFKFTCNPDLKGTRNKVPFSFARIQRLFIIGKAANDSSCILRTTLRCTMCPLNTNDLHRIFQKLDKNGDGLLSTVELNWLLESIGVHFSLEELEFSVGKSCFNFDEFLLFYDSITKQSDDGNNEAVLADDHQEGCCNKEDCDVVKAFKVFDSNDDGFISCEELQSLLSRLGLWDEKTGMDCRNMICKYDTNLDGVLDFEEFKKMMLHTGS